MDDTVSGPPAPPELTHLMMTVHTSDSGYRTLTVSFLVNVRQTLHEEFEKQVHDAVLLHAHHAGHMPVGPIFHTLEPWKPEPQGPLKEGTPLLRSLDDALLENEARVGNICKVSADVELGLSI
jgi:hypothetical protein